MLLWGVAVNAQSIYDRTEESPIIRHFAMPRMMEASDLDDATRGLDLAELLGKEKKPVFHIQKPARIIQGVPFTLTYVLEAPQWDNYNEPDFGTITENERTFNICESSIPGYYGLQCVHRVTANRNGRIPVPSCSFEVGDKRIYSDPDTLFVEQNPEFGQEAEAAYKFFTSKGIDVSELALEVSHKTQDMILLHDVSKHYFALVARKKYWPYIDNKVLVYSTENGLLLQPGDNSIFDDVFLRYSRQLHSLQDKSTQVKHTSSSTANIHVQPLLGCVRWGQNTPYNVKCPQLNNHPTMVGCVAVAISQLLHYYGKPDHIGTSPVYTPAWSSMNCTYSKDEGCYDVSGLMYAVGTALNAKYGSVQTSIDLNRLRDAMCQDFGYSSSFKENGAMSLQQQLDIIRTEIQSKRPCIISDFNHAFICDGIDGNYLHFNLGWNGLCNGYYLPLISSTNLNPSTEGFVKIISGIQP